MASKSSESFTESISSAFKAYAKSSEDASDDVKGAVTSSLDTLTDSLVEFSMTGKTSFKDMANSIISDMLRIAYQQKVTSVLSSGLGSLFGGIGTTQNTGSAANSLGYVTDSYTGAYGFANGGVMTPYGKAPVRKYASGGIAKSPQVAIYGEGSMNEAFVPLPDGNTIPVTMSGGGGATTNVTVVVNGNAEVSQSESTDAMGNKDLQIMIDTMVEKSFASGAQDNTLKSLGINKRAG